MNHNCRIIRRKVSGIPAFFFAYRASEEMSFEVSMFCEIGQPFQSSFTKLIKDQGLKLTTIEINESPWVITVEKKTAAKLK